MDHCKTFPASFHLDFYRLDLKQWCRFCPVSVTLQHCSSNIFQSTDGLIIIFNFIISVTAHFSSLQIFRYQTLMMGLLIHRNDVLKISHLNQSIFGNSIRKCLPNKRPRTLSVSFVLTISGGS